MFLIIIIITVILLTVGTVYGIYRIISISSTSNAVNSQQSTTVTKNRVLDSLQEVNKTPPVPDNKGSVVDIRPQAVNGVIPDNKVCSDTWGGGTHYKNVGKCSRDQI